MGESRHYTMITRLENEKIERKKRRNYSPTSKMDTLQNMIIMTQLNKMGSLLNT